MTVNNGFGDQGVRVSGDLLEVLAEKMVLSGQTLITMIAELKKNAAVSDFAALNQNIARQDAIRANEIADLHDQLAMLQQQLHQVCIHPDMSCLYLDRMMQVKSCSVMASYRHAYVKCSTCVDDAVMGITHLSVQVSRSA